MNNQCSISVSPTTEKWIQARDMPVGSLGMSRSGKIFYRTMETVTCLTEAGATFPGPLPQNLEIKLLDKGATVTLTQN